MKVTLNDDIGNEQSEAFSPARILSKIGCNNAKVSEAKQEFKFKKYMKKMWIFGGVGNIFKNFKSKIVVNWHTKITQGRQFFIYMQISHCHSLWVVKIPEMMIQQTYLRRTRRWNGWSWCKSLHCLWNASGKNEFFSQFCVCFASCFIKSLVMKKIVVLKIQTKNITKTC